MLCHAVSRCAALRRAHHPPGVDLFYKDKESAPGQPLLFGAALPWDFGEVYTPGGRSLQQLRLHLSDFGCTCLKQRGRACTCTPATCANLHSIQRHVLQRPRHDAVVLCCAERAAPAAQRRHLHD